MNGHEPTTVAIYSSLTDRYGLLADQRRRYLEAVDRHFIELARVSGRKWLDIGSGNGVRAVSLNRHLGKDLTVIEPSLLLGSDFEETHPDITVFRSTLRSASFSQKFDLVSLLWNVIGHVESLDESLRTIRDVLADDGVIFLDANSPFNLRRFGVQAVVRNFVRHGAIQFPWPERDSPARVNFFGRRLLEKKLKSAGFIPHFRYIDYDSGLPASSEFSGSIICSARKTRQ